MFQSFIPHKNKEIKRMLSKKMTVSLMSLITIFALAFVAPTAMAAIGVSLSDHADQPDIGLADGLQLERPSSNKLMVKVTFDEAVKEDDVTTNTAVGGFDMRGNYIPAVVLDKIEPADKAAREFTVTITITDKTARVALQIKEGIAAANAFSTRTSAALMENITLYDQDVDITPRVYGIRRADGSALPLTSGAVNVIITLSEEPQSFAAAHINVKNGTAGTPVALGAIRQNAIGLGQLSDHLDKPKPKERNVTEIRDGIPKTAGGTDVIKADGAVEDAPAMAGIEQYLSVAMEENDTIPADILVEVIALKKAIGSADLLTAGTRADPHVPEGFEINYYSLDKDGNLVTSVLEYEARATTDSPAGDGVNVSDTDDGDGNGTADDAEKGMPIIDGAIVAPTTQATMNLGLVTAVAADGTVTVSDTDFIAKEVFDRSAKKTSYTRPNLATFDTQAAYDFALSVYRTQTGATADAQRKAYAAEKKIYEAYKDLQAKLIESDMEAVTKWQEELIDAAGAGTTTQIAQDVLPPTGRDGMLHPYSVAITPDYTMDETVVTVNRWQNAASDPGVYKPPVLETDFTEGFDKLTIRVTPTPAAAAAVQPSGVIVFTVPAGFFK